MDRPAKLSRRAPTERQSAVLDAAEALFVEQGVEATTIEAIARRAGVAKGTVYLYFPSKEHLVSELEARFEQRIVGRLVAAASSSTHTVHETAVEDWCAALVDAYLDELAVHDMLFSGRGSASRENLADNVLVRSLRDLLAERGDDLPEETAVFLVGGITALVDAQVLLHSEPPRSPLIRAARRFAASTR